MTKTVRITKQGLTFGKIGNATWDAKANKWEVAFGSPWVGWYCSNEIEPI